MCTSPTWIKQEGFPYGSTTEDYRAGYHKLLETPDEYYEDCVRVNFTDHCTNTDKEQLADNLRAILTSNDKYAIAGILNYFSKEPLSLINNLSKITIPTLIITGGNDPVAPSEIGEFMKKRIKNATLYLFPCNGHSLIQTRPQDFVNAVKNFLKGINSSEPDCLEKQSLP